MPQNEPLLISSIPLPDHATARQGAFQRIDRVSTTPSLARAYHSLSIIKNWRRTVTLNGILVAFGSLTVALMGWLILRGYRSERAEAWRREQAKAKMIDAMRMEAVGQLTAGVAHDFSNLLTVISGNIERLLGSGIGDGNARIEAALAADNTRRRPHSQNADFAGPTRTSDPEIVEISAALTSFKPLLGSALGKNVFVEYKSYRRSQ